MYAPYFPVRQEHAYIREMHADPESSTPPEHPVPDTSEYMKNKMSVYQFRALHIVLATILYHRKRTLKSTFQLLPILDSSGYFYKQKAAFVTPYTPVGTAGCSNKWNVVLYKPHSRLKLENPHF
jgi:hypothetical protein